MVEPRNAQLKKPVHELLFQTIGENAEKKANENSLFQGDQTAIEDRAWNVRRMVPGSVERRWTKVEREG